MTMKNPCPLGRDIGFALEYLGLFTFSGAKALGASRSQLHRVIQSECAIMPELALRIEMVIGNTMGSWLRMQTAYNEAQICKKATNLIKKLKRLSILEKSKKVT